MVAMIKSTFDLEKKLASEGYKIIIGIDEAGRGPLCGPVVAAAAVFRDPEYVIPKNKVAKFFFIRDSKTIAEKKREELFDVIHEHFYVGVGICDHATIDRINILEATFLAMKKAVTELRSKLPQEMQNLDGHIILIDGNKAITNLSYLQKAVVGGDRIVKSISAASIIAKVTRDRIMREMHAKYPMYGFDSHKGYGTAQHLKMLREHGPCEIHRKSFEPVKILLKKKI